MDDTVTSTLARLGERRQVGMHRYRGDVLQRTLPTLAGTLMPNCASMLLKVCRVNGAVWSPPLPLSRPPGHSHHLVGPHALDAGDILQLLGRAGGQEQRGEGQQVFELGHRERPQNGHSGLRKKRSSQPG